MNQPSPHIKSVETDYRGQPITSGIPVRNNADWAVKYAVLGGLTWFLSPFFFGAWFAWLFGALVLFELPASGVLVLSSKGITNSGPLAVVGAVAFVIAFALWVRYAWRFTKRCVKFILTDCKLRYVGDYTGPSLGTKTLDNVIEQRNPGQEDDIAEWLSWHTYASPTDAVIDYYNRRYHRDIPRWKAKLESESGMWRNAYVKSRHL